MLWCTWRLVAPRHLNGPPALGSCGTTHRRSRTPSKQRNGDGLLDVHANARYADKILACGPQELRDVRADVLSVRTTSFRYLLRVCELRGIDLRFFARFLNVVILFALSLSAFVFRRSGIFVSLIPFVAP